VIYAQKGDLEKAARFFQKAVAINPVFKDAVDNLNRAKAALMKAASSDS
jgi:tetratricopeptide (TPR) repeat protein